MKKLTITVLTLLLSVFTFAMPSHAAGWKLEKEKKGVKVFTKEIPGNPLKAFRGETTIKAKITDIAFLFNNTASYPKWMADVKYSKLVKKNSDTDQYVYLVQSTPPPVKDRDVIARGVVTQDPQTLALTVNISSAANMVKPNNKYVRIPKMTGKFVFTPAGSGNLKVVYELSADPGGAIPSFVANTVAINTPYKTLRNLKDISDDLEKYRDPNMKIIFKDAS